MGVDHLAGKSVGLNGVAQLVGEGAAIFIHRQKIQLVLALQNGGIAIPQQQIEQKTQIEMGIIGKQQGVAGEHIRNIRTDLFLGNAPLEDVHGGNPGELGDHVRHGVAGGQRDQIVIFPGDNDFIFPALQYYGGKFNDLIPGEIQSGSFGIKNDEFIVFFRNISYICHIILLESGQWHG